MGVLCDGKLAMYQLGYSRICWSLILLVPLPQMLMLCPVYTRWLISTAYLLLSWAGVLVNTYLPT